MGAIDDLQSAASDFENSRIELDTALLALNYKHQARSALGALGALGADVVACARHQLPHAAVEHLASVAHEISVMTSYPMPSPPKIPASEDSDTAIRIFKEWFEEYSKSVDPQEIGAQIAATTAAFEAGAGQRARLLLAFKSSYFMIRALQDALYLAILFVIQNQVVERGSMQSALRDGNPVRSFLGELADDYFVWFAGWRSIRNSIKVGNQDGIVGPINGKDPDDYGLNLARIDSNGSVTMDVSRGTHISDVTKAINMTNRLVIHILAAAHEKVSKRSAEPEPETDTEPETA